MLRSLDPVLPSLPVLPEPLAIRRALIEDAAQLADLCGRAYVEEIWDTKSTELELFHDRTVKAVLLVTDKTQIASTASLQVHKGAPHSGQLRWIATEPDMRRQGLAKALVVRLLEIAKTEGCKEVYLKTTTDALGAIALYLNLGFKPMLNCDKERDIWSDVFRLLDSDPYF